MNNFPVLDLGIKPNIRKTDCSLRVFGLVEKELKFDWAAISPYAIRVDMAIDIEVRTKNNGEITLMSL